MSVFLIFIIAFALAMDAFAVSVGICLGLKGVTKKQTIRLALHFGVFQSMMAVIGWQAANTILIKYIETFDHWVAFGLLLIVGLKMILESFGQRERAEKDNKDPTKGISLIVLSVATSIDALAVGLSFAALRLSILYPIVVIGGVAFLMTILGARIGPILGRVIGKWAEFSGGLILIFIGIKILLDHL